MRRTSGSAAVGGWPASAGSECWAKRTGQRGCGVCRLVSPEAGFGSRRAGVRILPQGVDGLAEPWRVGPLQRDDADGLRVTPGTGSVTSSADSRRTDLRDQRRVAEQMDGIRRPLEGDFHPPRALDQHEIRSARSAGRPRFQTRAEHLTQLGFDRRAAPASIAANVRRAARAGRRQSGGTRRLDRGRACQLAGDEGLHLRRREHDDLGGVRIRRQTHFRLLAERASSCAAVSASCSRGTE